MSVKAVAAVGVQLASLGVPQPVVEVATPAALGLRGPRAERVAGQVGNTRNASSSTGAPVSQASSLGGPSAGFLSGGMF